MRFAFLDIRFLAALVGGTVISLGLFLFMHALIATNQAPSIGAEHVNVVSFVKVKRQETIRHKQYAHPKKPPPPKNPPQKEQVLVAKQVQRQVQQLPTNIKLSNTSFGTGSGLVIGNVAPAANAMGSRQLTPMVRIRPPYPPLAMQQEVQGTVKTCFTVEPDGSVSNPYVVSASSPQARRMLAQAAIKGIVGWKFFPKLKDGKPIAAHACQDLEFHISKGAGG